jgi:hypothetical protein
MIAGARDVGTKALGFAENGFGIVKTRLIMQCLAKTMQRSGGSRILAEYFTEGFLRQNRIATAKGSKTHSAR